MFKFVKQWLAANRLPHSKAGFASPSAIKEGVEVSYSKLKAYLDCPWLYRIRYVEMKRPAYTPQSSFGQSIHKTLEAYHRQGDLSLEKLLEIYDEKWISGGYPILRDQMDWHQKGLKLLNRYWEAEQARRSKVVYVEREFLFELGPHQVRGMIDRVDLTPEGKYEVVDYKTHPHVATEEELKSNIQLLMYGLGVREGLGLEPSYLSLFYVLTGEKVTVPYDPSGEEALKAKIRSVADRIARKDFAPETSFCPGCDFRKTCPHSVARD